MRRLAGLDVLRATAIVWVMLFHSWLVGGLGPRFADLQNTGWMAVDLFFVLSGYLIGGQLLRPLSRGEPLNFWSFYRRRAFRIIPAFTVVLALYFMVPGFNREDGLAPLWEFLTYTVNLFIDYDTQEAFSNVWSLCVEEHFYLLFPFVVWFLTRRNSRAALLAAIVTVIVGGMLLRWSLWYHSQAHFLEVIYYPTYNRLDGLLAGVVLAAIEVYRPTTWAWLCRYANTVLLPLGIILLAIAIYVCQDKTTLLATVIGYPLIAWAMASFVIVGASPTGFLGWFCFPGVRWVALVSYSVYLIHKAIFKQVEAHLPIWFGSHPYLTFLAYSAAALMAGAVLHYAVERPFLQLRDRSRKQQTRFAESTNEIGKSRSATAS
jgi:peptidoglycan/LPS O-acetylase OafA/YrhL